MHFLDVMNKNMTKSSIEKKRPRRRRKLIISEDPCYVCGNDVVEGHSFYNPYFNMEVCSEKCAEYDDTTEDKEREERRR